MKNVVLKVLTGLCVVLLAVAIIETFIIKNKNKELKNSAAIISVKDKRINELENSEKNLTKYSKMLSSQLEYYQKPEEAKRLENMHPIEKEVYNCIKNVNGPTLTYSSKMAACVYESEAKWEKEIQKYLLELKKILTEEEYATLLTSQKDWEQYRKSQIKMIEKIYSNTLATIFQEYASSDTVTIAEKRARYLSWLLTISKDRK